MGQKNSHRHGDLAADSGSPGENIRELARMRKLKRHLNDYDDMGLTKLHIACEIGDVGRVVSLLLMGAQPDQGSSDAHGNTTPLIFAASNGHTQCVTALLVRGACPNATDMWGNTAIFKASTYNHLQCVKVLMKYGANPDVPNTWGALPLQYACLQGHDDVVVALVAGGCDVNVRGEPSTPAPLEAASQRGQVGCVKLLLEAGLSVNSGDALYNAVSSKYYYDRAESLMLHALGESTRLAARKQCNYAECIRQLVNAGANISEPCLWLVRNELIKENGPKQKFKMALLLLRATVCEVKRENRGVLGKIMKQAVQLQSSNSQIMQQIIDMVLAIGYNPTKKVLRKLKEGLPEGVYKSIEDVARSPRSLRNLACLSIRKNLPGNPMTGVELWEIPQSLKDDITFK